MDRLINFLGFQACWFACVLGAARGLPWLGPAVVGVWSLLHVAGARRRGTVVGLLAASAVFGFAVDTLHLRLGVLVFNDAPEAMLSRPWMVALWVAFATTLGSSLGWLSRRYHAAAVLGAAAGPVSYLAGARLGAITIAGEPAGPLLVLAVSWGFSLPLLVFAGDRLLGEDREVGAAAEPGEA